MIFLLIYVDPYRWKILKPAEASTTVHKGMPGTCHVPSHADLAFLSRGVKLTWRGGKRTQRQVSSSFTPKQIDCCSVLALPPPSQHPPPTVNSLLASLGGSTPLRSQPVCRSVRLFVHGHWSCWRSEARRWGTSHFQRVREPSPSSSCTPSSRLLVRPWAPPSYVPAGSSSLSTPHAYQATYEDICRVLADGHHANQHPLGHHRGRWGIVLAWSCRLPLPCFLLRACGRWFDHSCQVRSNLSCC